MSIRLSSKEQEELVLKNQRLVYHLVKKLGVAPSDYEDMVSIGTIGLIKAAATFDESKKTKFATYAARCINNEFFMHFRKEKPHANDISLQEPLSNDGEGNEITLSDMILVSNQDFTEALEKSEVFERLISIVLNLLESRERLMMLYAIAGKTQHVAEKKFNISQSYVSRLVKKVKQKVREYFTTNKEFREVFSMAIVGDSYQISFSSKDIKQFNKIFATMLSNFTSVKKIPDFKVSCNKERIIILVPAHPESFSFIAQIIQEIDDFSMTFVSDKTVVDLNNEREEDEEEDMEEEIVEDNAPPESSDSEQIEEDMSEGMAEETVVVEDTTIVKKESQVKQVRDYMLSKKSFTTKELKQHFPDMPYTSVANAINLAKKKGLITSTGRGEYLVNKT